MGKFLSLRDNISFTLAEVLLVVILMSLFLGLSIPQFTKFLQKIKFESEVENIISFLRMATEKAISTNYFVNVYIAEEDKNIIKMKYRKKIEDETKIITKILKIPDDLKIECDICRLMFEATGGIIIVDALNEGIRFNTHILIRDKYGRRMKITIYCTGLIESKYIL